MENEGRKLEPVIHSLRLINPHTEEKNPPTLKLQQVSVAFQGQVILKTFVILCLTK